MLGADPRRAAEADEKRVEAGPPPPEGEEAGALGANEDGAGGAGPLPPEGEGAGGFGAKEDGAGEAGPLPTAGGEVGGSEDEEPGSDFLLASLAAISSCMLMGPGRAAALPLPAAGDAADAGAAAASLPGTTGAL